MSNDLYTSNEQQFGAKFYVVSPKKFIVLFMGTFGAYSLYWFYQQWDYYRLRTDGKQWPIIRTLFPIFFVHSLLAIFSLDIKEKHVNEKQDVKYLATIFVLLSIVDYSLNILTEQGIGGAYLDLHAFVTLPIFCWLLYKMQLLVNDICDDSNGESNNTLTPVNYCWIVLISALVIWLYFLMP